jgi:hypothetical protein
MKKHRRRLLLVALLAVLGLFVAAWRLCWRSPPYFLDAPPVADSARILPFVRYGEHADHPRPYVVETPGVLLFGAAHTRSPRDPALSDMAARFGRFQPTVTLVEGRLGFLLPGFMDPVEKYGEMGHAFALARAAGVPVYTWDLPKDELARRLLSSFRAEQVALFVVLTPYFSQLRFGKPASPDDFVAGYLHRATAPELEGTLHTVADVDRLWARDFAGKPGWRDTSDEYGLPGYLQDLMNASNDARNEHLVRVIARLRERGERVFAVMGSSHAVCVEAALQRP